MHNPASADAANPAGYNEPNYCNEPQYVPGPGAIHNGHGPHPLGRPMVCLRCKRRRARDFEWRKESLRFGVCGTCKKRALEKVQPGQSDCVCELVGNYVNGANNNEPRVNHMCRMHDARNWMIIRDAAGSEIDVRRRMLRTQPKQKGHGWTHKKGPKTVRTPAQRRRATQLQLPAPTGVPPASTAWQVVPRCFCGEVIGAAGHAGVGPDAPLVESQQVRSCVGCNEFIRQW